MNHDASLKKYALISVTLASFLTPFMGSAINLAIPAIGRQFNSSTFMLGWVVTSYLLATAALLLPFGRIADLVGRKRVFAAGIIIFTLASLLCGLAWSIQVLIAFRLLQGLGSAMIFGTAMAILTSVFPPQERGKVLGINVATVYLGLSLGPVIGGFLNHYFSWQSIFFFNVLIGLAALYLIVYKLKGEWKGAADEKLDYLGALLYSLGLILFMYGMSSFTNLPAAKVIFLLGLLVLLFFVIYEKRAAQPLLNLQLFTANNVFAFSNLAALVNYSATFGIAYLLSLYLQVVLHYDSQIAGLILLAQPVIMTVISPFAGYLSDRIEPRIVASLGMGITAVAVLLFVFIGLGTPIWLVAANLSLLGTGLALFSSPNSNAVMGSVEKRFYGVASSTLASMRMVGQTVSMALVSLIMAANIGNAQLDKVAPQLLVKSAHTSFLVFAVLCLAGVFASLARGNLRNVAG